MLTTPDGPVLISLRSMQALMVVKKFFLLPQLFPDSQIGILASDWEFVMPGKNPESWFSLLHDAPDYELPERITAMVLRDHDSERAIQVGLTVGASMIMLDGPVKEIAKLSFIKSMGSLSLMVEAYRHGMISGVKPMVKIWQKLGFEDILPDQQMLDSLWAALDAMEES